MKTGAFWQCVSSIHKDGFEQTDNVIIGGIYTVNYFGYHKGYKWIGFEETPQDEMYLLEDFREVVFPPNMELEIQECLTKELYII